MENIVGKYILVTWECRDYSDKWLRFINRETKDHYISDVNYSLNVGTGYTYSIMKNCAFKLAKTKDGGFTRSIGVRANTDGQMTFKVMEKPSDIYCTHSFDEIFNTDLRISLGENSHLVKDLREFNEIAKLNPDIEEGRWFLKNHLRKRVDELSVAENFLMNLFNVNEIYRLQYSEDTDNSPSFIQKDIVYMQLNMFANYKEIITLEERKPMTTIGFWLFENKLCYFYATGKSSW